MYGFWKLSSLFQRVSASNGNLFEFERPLLIQWTVKISTGIKKVAEIETWNGKICSSAVKTESNRCVMIESLWNEYDVSRKSPELAVRRLPEVVRNERALELNAQWDSPTNERFAFITTGNEVSWRRRQNARQNKTNVNLPLCPLRWCPKLEPRGFHYRCSF